jgi:hypothetical protein
MDVGGITWRGDTGERWNVQPFGNGLALRQPLVIPVTDTGGGHLCDVDIGIVGGKPGCVAIRAREKALTVTMLRNLPQLSTLVEKAARANVVRVVRTEDGEFVGEMYVDKAPPSFDRLRSELDAELRPTRRKRTLTDGFLQDVAEAYREAVQAGVSTQSAIQGRWLTSATNARRWVALARERGFLGPAPAERKAGEATEEEGEQ